MDFESETMMTQLVAFKGIGRIRSLFSAINICAYNLFIQEMCDYKLKILQDI